MVFFLLVSKHKCQVSSRHHDQMEQVLLEFEADQPMESQNQESLIIHHQRLVHYEVWQIQEGHRRAPMKIKASTCGPVAHPSWCSL